MSDSFQRPQLHGRPCKYTQTAPGATFISPPAFSTSHKHALSLWARMEMLYLLKWDFLERRGEVKNLADVHVKAESSIWGKIIEWKGNGTWEICFGLISATHS